MDTYGVIIRADYSGLEIEITTDAVRKESFYDILKRISKIVLENNWKNVSFVKVGFFSGRSVSFVLPQIFRTYLVREIAQNFIYPEDVNEV